MVQITEGRVTEKSFRQEHLLLWWGASYPKLGPRAGSGPSPSQHFPPFQVHAPFRLMKEHQENQVSVPERSSRGYTSQVPKRMQHLGQADRGSTVSHPVGQDALGTWGKRGEERFQGNKSFGVVERLTGSHVDYFRFCPLPRSTFKPSN